jgi:hypothetical protein
VGETAELLKSEEIRHIYLGDEGIAEGNGGFAVAATAAKEKPPEDGDVVIPGEGMLAPGTMRWRGYQRFPAEARHAPDEDIEEAAYASAQSEQEDAEGPMGQVVSSTMNDE